jgi:phage-related protein
VAGFSAGSASVSVVPDFRGAQKAIAEWFGSQRDMRVGVRPEVDQATMTAERARIESNHAKLHVDIDQDHLRQSFLTAVDQLTGLSTVQAAFEKLFGPKSILVTSGVGALTAIASSAAQAGGALALLPAGLAAIVGPAATVAVGVQGVGAAFKAIDTGNVDKINKAMANLAPNARGFVTEIQSLKPAWEGLRLETQNLLFANLGQTIGTLARNYIPALREGMGDTAVALNGVVRGVADVLNTKANVSAFTDIWINIANAVESLIPAAKNFTQILLTVTKVGSDFLPGMADAISRISGKWNEWVQQAAATGQLANIIHRAVDEIKALAEIAGNLVGTLANVFKAALPAGEQLTSLVNVLTGYLKQLSGSTAGQTALKTFFNGIADAVHSLMPGIQAMIDALVTGVLPQIGNLAKTLAPVVSGVLTQFAQMLKVIAPLIYPTLAQAVAVFVGAMAPVIPQLTQVAQVLFPALARILTAISPSIGQLTTVIGQALVSAVKILVPIIEALVVHLLPILVDIIKFLAPALGPIAVLILGVVAAMKVWAAIQTVLNLIMAANPIGLIVVAIGLLVVAITEIIAHLDFFKGIWNTVWGAVRDFFVGIWTSVRDFFVNTWNAIVAWFVNAFAAYNKFWTDAWNAISNFFVGIWNGIKDFFIGLFGPLIQWFAARLNEVLAGWQVIWTAIKVFFTDIWNAIVAFLTPLVIAMRDFFVAVYTGVRDFFVNIFTSIRDYFVGIWSNIRDSAVSLWNQISGFFTTSWANFTKTFTDVWNNIKGFFLGVWQGMVDGVKQIWEGIKAVFAAPINFVINTILNDGLFKAWNWIVDHLGLPGANTPNGGWKLHVDPIPGFKVGGYTGDIPDDAPAGVVHGGEFVFTARQTRNAGPGRLAQYAAALDSGFYEGGYVDPALAAVLPGYQVGGTVTPGAMTWQNLWQIIHKQFPNSILTSAYRAGAADYHGLGEAIDVSFPGNPQSLLMPVAAWIASNFPNSTELIHNPNGSIKNGKPVPPGFWGTDTWMQHINHVHWAMTPDAIAGGGGGGANVVLNPSGFFGEVWNSVTDVLGDLSRSISGPIGDMFNKFGHNSISEVLGAIPGSLINKMWDTLSGPIGTAFNATVQSLATAAGISPSTSYPQSAPGTAGIKQQAFQIAGQQFGWNAVQQQQALDYIASHESGWNPTAQNPVSTASGIWQMVNGTWNAYKNAGPWPTARSAPPAEQDAAAFRYIRNRYGDPVAAQQYWAAHHNYDSGGWLPPGITTVYNGTGRPEPVLTAAEHDGLTSWRSWHDRDRGRGDGLMRDVHIHHERGDGREIMDELWHRLQVESRGGAYSSPSTVYVAG